MVDTIGNRIQTSAPIDLNALKAEPGELIRSADWNQVLEAIAQRIQRAGDEFTGDLTIQKTLTVRGNLSVAPEPESSPSGNTHPLQIALMGNVTAQSLTVSHLLECNTIEAIGSDADQNITLKPKGAGKLQVRGSTAIQNDLTVGGGSLSVTAGGDQESRGLRIQAGSIDDPTSRDMRIVWETGADRTATTAIASHPDTNNKAGDLRFQTAVDGTLQERMIIDSAGNVGIGVIPTSAAKLAVSGTVQATEIRTEHLTIGSGESAINVADALAARVRENSATNQDLNPKSLTVTGSLTIASEDGTTINVAEALAAKANRNGATDQDFDAKNLTVAESLTINSNGDSINVRNTLAGKADRAEVDTALNLKVNRTDLDNALNLKANRVEVDDALNLKVNRTDLDNALNLKANRVEVDDALNLKVNKTDLDNALNLKANRVEVDDALNLKVNKTDLDNALNLKVNRTDLDDALNLKANKADLAYIDAQVATKAALTGSATQNFQTKDLRVAGNLDVAGTTTFRNIEQHQGDLELGNEDTDQVRIHGIVRSTHSSGSLQFASPLNVTGELKLQTGVAVNKFSSDGALAGNSDLNVPTEKAVKTYVDTQVATKVAPAGSATQNFQTNDLRVAGTLAIGTGATAVNVGTTLTTLSTTLDGKAEKNGATDQNFNAQNLTVNGNVGIGTTAPPVSKLTINNDVVHDNGFNAYGDAPLTIFEPTTNGGSNPTGTRDILNLVREGVTNQAYGNKVSLAIGRYENVGSNSRTQLDIKLTDGEFNRHNTIMSLRSNGKVGIGTVSPATDATNIASDRNIILDVVGGIRIHNPRNPNAQWIDFFYDRFNVFCMYYRDGNGIFVGTNRGQREQ